MSDELTFDAFMERFQPNSEQELPLDFSYEKDDKCFYIVLVVLWRIQDAFVLHPRLRSFVEVTVETKEQYVAMMTFLRKGRDEAVKYLDKCLADCEEEGF